MREAIDVTVTGLSELGNPLAARLFTAGMENARSTLRKRKTKVAEIERDERGNMTRTIEYAFE